VPDIALTRWLLGDLALVTRDATRIAAADYVAAENSVLRAADRAAEQAEGTGVGDLEIYRSSEGRE